MTELTQLSAERDTGEIFVRRGYVRRDSIPYAEEDPDPRLSPQRAGENPGMLRSARQRHLRQKPPLLQLVNRPRGPALPLHLVALYVAACIAKPGQRSANDRRNTYAYLGNASWATLIADTGRPADRGRHLRDALARLTDIRLVERATSDSWEGWRLLVETGSGERSYRVPSERGNIGVPELFFINGWYLVLPRPAIALWLVMRDMHSFEIAKATSARTGIGLPTGRRRGEYGMSDEVYEAHRVLTSSGLIKRLPDQGNQRRAGRGASSDDPQRETHHFHLNDRRLERIAVDTVDPRWWAPSLARR